MPLPSRAFRIRALAVAPLLLSACGLTGSSGDGGPAVPDRSPGAAAPAGGAVSAEPSHSPRPPGTIAVAIAGDVHFTGRTTARLDPGAEPALGPIAATLSDADVAVLNLETAITERGTPEAKLYTFRTPAKALDLLRRSGVDVISMANNHAVDFGPAGLQDTLAAVRSSPVGVVGIGPDATAAYRPWTTTANGVRVAVVAASQVQDLTIAKYPAGEGKPGIASALRPERLLKAVRDAKRTADVVIVYLHWGNEGEKCPNATQTGLARQLANAGATAVVGTHAHVMQGAGMLGGTYVAYGTGNFLWYGTSPYPDSDDTGVTTLTITGGKVVGEHFTPALVDARGVPVPQAGAEARRITERREGLRPCTGLAEVP